MQSTTRHFHETKAKAYLREAGNAENPDERAYLLRQAELHLGLLRTLKT